MEDFVKELIELVSKYRMTIKLSPQIDGDDEVSNVSIDLEKGEMKFIPKYRVDN